MTDRNDRIREHVKRARQIFLIEMRRQQTELWGDIFPPEWMPATVEKMGWTPTYKGESR